MAGIEPGVHRKVEVPVVNVDNLSDESKAEFLKRRAYEERALKKSNRILEEWYCLGGEKRNKLLKKILKANGCVYSFFMFRIDKNKELYQKHYIDENKVKPEGYDPKEKWAEEIKKAKRK